MSSNDVTEDQMKSTINNDALRVLDKAIVYGLSCSGRKKPGVVIESLSKEDRKVLSELTSDDAIQQRPIFLEKS